LGRSLQLLISGASILKPVHLLADALLHSQSIKTEINSLECLSYLYLSGHLLPRHFPAEPRGRRLRFVLQALDGHLVGASHRDIAVALFGPARVSVDWGDPGGHLRDRVRRAIARGRALMDRGYRAFLG
jgi:hypothetical protein